MADPVIGKLAGRLGTINSTVSSLRSITNPSFSRCLRSDRRLSSRRRGFAWVAGEDALPRAAISRSFSLGSSMNYGVHRSSGAPTLRFLVITAIVLVGSPWTHAGVLYKASVGNRGDGT